MQVAELIEALNLVGHVYRNKDGTKPADAVSKIVGQLKGAENLTLGEWAEQKRVRSKPKKNNRTQTQRGVIDEREIDDAIAQLQSASTQAELRATIRGIELSAPKWKALAKKVTGKAGSSKTNAIQAVESMFSNELLAQDRTRGISRLFG